MYNYHKGKDRIEEILKNNLKIIDENKLPKSEKITFDNAYNSWICSIFIDIRDSSTLFKTENNENISKIMKCFTSELIEIMRKNDNIRDIGIRGDCVYSIYTAPTKQDIKDIYFISCYCNTYIKMLNKLLIKYNLPKIKTGIGIGASKTLIIKAGWKDVGINDKIWIGNSVIDASNFSSIANTGGLGEILVSSSFYSNLTSVHEKAKKLFTKKSSKYGTCYSGNIIMIEFNNWIQEEIN